MIRIVDIPDDFVFPVPPLMWLAPVELPAGLPDSMGKDEVAYDLLSGSDGHLYYVGLGDGTACYTSMVSLNDCHHGVTKRIASRLSDEGYPPTKKCVDCGMVCHMVWGPWAKPFKQP